ncbi:MAG: GIY-YIG nuclease family protein [Candidatus Daviesbacteria bacterium]|nr:GIY-YIG nuclease family protein [Candidatus Daviesbacteria bacterium]
MIPSYLDKTNLPHKSGVYIFKGGLGKILYVGKAIDIYHRVASYFNKRVAPKTAVLVEKIKSVDTIIVESELEALILEANLIKKFLPPFNVALTDDKDYLYIGLSKDTFPKIITVRRQDLKKTKQYWGPFPSTRTVRDTLKTLRRIFPWCSGGLRRACFYYHLGLCPGACLGLITKDDYHKIIRRFSKFLEGKKDELLEELTSEMNEASNHQEYEQAAKMKKIIEGINYLTQPNRVRLYLDNPNFLQEENVMALKQLQKDLNLATNPERIEGYDISNIGGKEATGSMVVLTNGEIDKSQYRKFKIHPPAGGPGKPNDVAMHKEMIKRRLKHPEWPLPDLIIVDGGRGQARAANYELQTMKYQIPIYGLAKRLEWLYPPQGDIIKLSRKSLSLKLLQKLRDEAHRFAITYHRKLRDKIMMI